MSEPILSVEGLRVWYGTEAHPVRAVDGVAFDDDLDVLLARADVFDLDVLLDLLFFFRADCAFRAIFG